MCAIKDGRSVDSTMGFTAVDGLPMGTRSGALDPGVVLFLLQQRGYDAAALERLLYKEFGLLGISVISNDMRDLLASPDPRAGEGVDVFCYHIAKNLGALAMALGGLEALVFTAGIARTQHLFAPGFAPRLAGSASTSTPMPTAATTRASQRRRAPSPSW